MILLDTNVISEPIKANGDTRVLEWMDAQLIDTLYLSTITLAELRYGVAALPDGKRKDTLGDNLEKRIVPLFHGRILPFDDDAARAYAIVRSQARAAGKAIAATDGFIAAIATAHGLAIATRDTSPFEAAGLEVIDPWNWKAST